MLAALVAVLLAHQAPTPPPTAAPALEAAPAATTPTSASTTTTRRKLLVLEVQGSDLEPSQRETLTATLTARAARFPSLEVLSSLDLRALSELRADQAASGCDEAAASCMAELANALGAEWVLSTRAGRLDALTVVTLQVFDARKGAVEGRASVQGWSLPEVTDKLGLAIDELLTRATGEQPSDEVAPSLAAGPRPAAGSSPIATGLLVGGAVALALGVVAGGLGLTPALLYDGKKQELVQLTAGFDGSPEQLDRAGRLQREAGDLKQLYNGVGRFGVLAGVLLVPLGGGALALSFLWPASAEVAP